jgi:hypothetical protein
MSASFDVLAASFERELGCVDANRDEAVAGVLR